MRLLQLAIFALANAYASTVYTHRPCTLYYTAHTAATKKLYWLFLIFPIALAHYKLLETE